VRIFTFRCFLAALAHVAGSDDQQQIAQEELHSGQHRQAVGQRNGIDLASRTANLFHPGMARYVHPIVHMEERVRGTVHFRTVQVPSIMRNNVTFVAPPHDHGYRANGRAAQHRYDAEDVEDYGSDEAALALTDVALAEDYEQAGCQEEGCADDGAEDDADCVGECCAPAGHADADAA